MEFVKSSVLFNCLKIVNQVEINESLKHLGRNEWPYNFFKVLEVMLSEEEMQLVTRVSTEVFVFVFPRQLTRYPFFNELEAFETCHLF